MVAPTLSKTRIQNGRQCHKRLWLEIHRRDLANWGEASELRLSQGTAFGELARELLGGGTLVEQDHTQTREALAETERLLSLHRSRAPMVFEPAFEYRGVRVRVDALRRGASGDTLIEVKSTTAAKPEHIWDCAIQTWVSRGAGRRLTRIQVAHLNREFVYTRKGDFDGLLTLSDITPDVEALQAEVPRVVTQLKRVAAGSMPDVAVGAQCTSPYPCPFIEHCSSGAPAAPEYPVTLLPYGGRLVDALVQEGYTDLRKVPLDRLQNSRHRRVAEACRTGKVHVDPELHEQLDALPYPRYFLDFEAISFPVPRWLGTRPFQQVAFQFSCHVQDKAGSAPQHHELLDVEDSHPEPRLASRLVEVLGDRGPILVWNQAFEAQILRQMAAAQPRLRGRLLAIANRLVDLLPLYRNHYYHPAQKGSWSLKAVLPTVAPDLAYEGLEVANGLDAQVAYAQLLEGGLPDEQAKELQAALKRYCAIDTAGLIALAALKWPKPSDARRTAGRGRPVRPAPL